MAESLGTEMRRTGKGMKAVMNEALKLGLRKAARPPRFEIQPHAFGFRPEIDLDRINQLVDELESEEVARKLRP